MFKVNPLCVKIRLRYAIMDKLHHITSRNLLYPLHRSIWSYDLAILFARVEQNALGLTKEHLYQKDDVLDGFV